MARFTHFLREPPVGKLQGLCLKCARLGETEADDLAGRPGVDVE